MSSFLERRARAPSRLPLLEVPWMHLRKQTVALTAEDQGAEEIVQFLVGHTTLGPGSRCSAWSTPTALCPSACGGPPRQFTALSESLVAPWVGRRAPVLALYDLGSNLGFSMSSLEPQINLSFSRRYSAEAKFSKSGFLTLSCHLWPSDPGQITRSQRASIPHL